jgi:hypothetical protein
MGINYGPNGGAPPADYVPRYGDGRPMFTGLRGETLSARGTEMLLRDLRKRRLAQTWLKNGRERVHISTIFLPLDMGFMGESEKWETMVFGGPLDEYQERYATRAEAKDGHRVAVGAVRMTIEAQQAVRARRRRMHKTYRAAWA